MRRALFALIPAALTACGALPFPAYERCDAAPGRAELARAVPRAPDTAALVSLRVTIERGSLQQALTLHGVVFPSGSLYFQSINDWGGSGCALRRDARGSRGLSTPEGLPAELWETLIDALAVALAPPRAADAVLVRLDTGAWALLARHGDEEILLAPSGERVRYDVGRDGRWLSTVSCAGSFRDAFDRPVCPRRIDVVGHQAGVWASAEVFAWEPSNAEELELGREFEQAFGDR